MSTTYRLTVNREAHEVTVDHNDTPLLYVLRDALKLKGTRFGCGNGQCGACTVLLDARAAKSCDIPIWSVEGKSITTIEGLGTHARLHPLQQAILDSQAGQCGYCLSGIIMSAAELMVNDAHPSRKKIVEALAANLCRCGAHTRIIKAVEAAWNKIAEGADS
jgi:aerobic-type carbon monoxide dehydrogenase small subunit (CoxS/CutS family)